MIEQISTLYRNIRIEVSKGKFRRLDRKFPVVFDLIANQIRQGAHPGGIGIENIIQYEAFRQLWEEKNDEKLPDYKVAVHGPLFADQY